MEYIQQGMENLIRIIKTRKIKSKHKYKPKLSLFHFKKYKFGPYDHSIDIISRNIKEYVEY